MGDKPKDSKLRTKAFALRIIHMYSKLPKNDTVAQVLGKLELLVGSGCVSAAKMAGLLDENRELIAIFTTINKRSKDDL